MSQSKFKVGSLLGSTALVALGVAFAGQATAGDHARVVKSSTDQVSLRFSGQFSREMNYIDDGHNERVRHGDSNYSSSRFRFHASGKINADMKVDARNEIAFDDSRNAIANTVGAANGGRSGNDLQTRKTEIYITHNQFGRVWMGAGDPAANGVMNINTHGIYSALPGFMGLIAAGVQFRDTDDEHSFGGASTTLGRQFADLDFNSRQTRIRYDTPVIAGFMASVSHDDDQSIEAALRYSGNVLDSRVRFGMAMAHNTNSGSNVEEMYGAQLSFTHSSGLGLTSGIAFQEDHAPQSAPPGSTGGDIDKLGVVVQGHFKRKFNELGSSTVVVEYDQKENMNTSGDVAKGFGVTLHQAIDAAAMEVWFKFSNYELEKEGTDFDDINIVTLGTRMKF